MTSNEFKRRRRQLMRMMGPGSIAILPTAPVSVRNRDAEYPYRPDSDFYYMTGFAEPEAVAVLIPGRRPAEYVLFCRERDPDKEMWDGSRAGQEGAQTLYGAEDSFPIGDLDDILPRMLEQSERVFYAMGCNPELDKRMSEWISGIRSKGRAGIQGPLEFIALDHYLHDMRLYKSRTGHWLGMDVHDVGDYKVDGTWRLLEPGMVLTVEPGLYIPAGSKGVAKKWWGIGIRIEDDVVVTKDGCDILSKDAPKTVAEIEALMAQPADSSAPARAARRVGA